METTKVLAILYTILSILSWLVSFYMAFVFCAINLNQRLLFLMVNIGVVFIDIVLFDLFCEMFITILYTMRNKAQCAISFMDPLNRFKSFKVLAP